MSFEEVKIVLLKAGKKQVDLLEEIRKRGYPNLYDSQLSRYVTGRERGPQAAAVMELCEEIIDEWENERKGAQKCDG